MTDTIYALSSGALPAAIAVVRISGPAAFAAAAAMSGPLPEARLMTLRTIRDPRTQETLDRGLIVVFPADQSVTGEDLVELHLHGSIAVVRAVGGALSGLPDVRTADPGEFTRRSLMAGKIDLSAAEGLADLLAAETDMQRRTALRLSEGGLRRLANEWADRLVAYSAEIEAAIEFAEDHDLDIAVDMTRRIDTLSHEIGSAIASPGAERVRDGVRVVLAGPPNAGKSTLFNALAGRDAAIVSSIAGTTRDRIEAPIHKGGVMYLLIDTAGLTETEDSVEAAGVERARDAAGSADILLWLGPDPAPAHAVPVRSKSDLIDKHLSSDGAIDVSGKTGAGLATLWRAIAERAAALLPTPNDLIVNQRQRDVLQRCRDILGHWPTARDVLVQAELLREARHVMGDLSGGGAEMVLDAVFARFCVGK